MRILLDTSAYSRLMRGHGEVARLVRGSEAILFSSVVVGELLYGFRLGAKYQRNREALDVFLRHPRVSFVPVTLNTADRYGRVMSELRSRGTPIPTNDAWIAAQTLETGVELVSFDEHFGKITNLPWIRPGDE